ncbi:MAG: hypothetical protein HY689_13260 [Chloroflexi bacterium]|nr:hypothetical protein [Chloroflexota bacterium]
MRRTILLPPSTPRWLRPWHVVGAVALLYLGIALARTGGDPLTFVMRCPNPEQIPTGTCGYDGQFAYAIAMDPAGAAPFMDVPAYRYQRILYPLLARVLGAGQPDLVPWTLVLINWVALAAGTAVLEAVLCAYGVSRWYALAYGLFAGVLMPVRLDLTEPLAYALALGGVLAAMRGRGALSGVLLALAALTKETTLLFAAGVVAGYALRGAGAWRSGPAGGGAVPAKGPEARAPHAFRDAATLGVMAVAPFVLWQVALRAQFGQFGIGSGGALATPFEWVPLRGWWSLVSARPGAFLLLSLIMVPMAVMPALVGLWLALRDVAQRRYDVPALLLLFHAAVVLFTPQSTFREPLGMVRFIVGLVAATVIYAAARRSRRGLNYALLWVFTLGLALNEFA